MRTAPFDRVSWRPRLRAWCLDNLGAAPAQLLFEDGWSGAVVGLRLTDGANVVVKIRPWEARLVACTEVQKSLAAQGFPCPTPLVVPQEVDGLAISAEALVRRPRLTEPEPVAMAAQLHRLIRLAPPRDIAPAPPWARPDHSGPGRWPETDVDIRLDDTDLPDWLTGLADRVRARTRDLPAGVVGHTDFEAQNLGADLTVYDFDSLATRPEPFHAGLAAAVWCADDAGLAACDLRQSEAFLAAYEDRRGRPFDRDEHEIAWAAGLWVDSANAAVEIAAGRPGQALATLAAEHAERARRAGL